MAVRCADSGLRICAAAFEVVGAEGAGRECGGRVAFIRFVLSHALADHDLPPFAIPLISWKSGLRLI